MINSVDTSGYSLIMSAIDYKNKHPYERFNNKNAPTPDELSLSEAIEILQRDSLLRFISVSNQLSQSQSVLRSNIT